VTDNKNTLGVVLLVIALGAVWNLLDLLRSKGRANKRRHLVAQGVLLAFALALLHMAHSATSLACFMLGCGLILATNHRVLRGKKTRVQLLCSSLVIVGALTFFLTGHDDVANALGRDSTLSGRTVIWAALIPTVPNSIVGAGFESYWISSGPLQAWHTLSQLGWWHPEILVPEAHNGYIEIFLNLGWIGVGLISLILISGYRRALDAFRLNPPLGSLTLAYVMASATYSITEAGFRSLDPIWVFLILSIFTSTAVTTGIIRALDRQPKRAYKATRENPELGTSPSELPAMLGNQ
jgi:O-antigen ligase